MDLLLLLELGYDAVIEVADYASSLTVIDTDHAIIRYRDACGWMEHRNGVGECAVVAARVLHEYGTYGWQLRQTLLGLLLLWSVVLGCVWVCHSIRLSWFACFKTHIGFQFFTLVNFTTRSFGRTSRTSSSRRLS